jgi:four helix bundle protein
VRHQDTRIYQRALELIDLAKLVIAELPVGYAFLTDQLRRAASSIALNFAEGCGKLGERDRRRYFLTARGSAYEVAAILDVGLRFGAIDAGRCHHGNALCDQLAAMLSCFH